MNLMMVMMMMIDDDDDVGGKTERVSADTNTQTQSSNAWRNGWRFLLHSNFFEPSNNIQTEIHCIRKFAIE